MESFQALFIAIGIIMLIALGVGIRAIVTRRKERRREAEERERRVVQQALARRAGGVPEASDHVCGAPSDDCVPARGLYPSTTIERRDDGFDPLNPISPLSPLNPLSPVYYGHDSSPAPCDSSSSSHDSGGSSDSGGCGDSGGGGGFD